ncbi:acyl carrier protein [Mycobacterium sp. SP-6446]|uniref:acyl carrier protein n=1 Tax=Mycobacterium sp. SP-6446 TaxID=1834162 RepID=UPI0009F88960|nr:acyl carrier protein [Mycobacterium sp. SP-6446]
MTGSTNASHNDEPEIRTSGKPAPVSSTPLTRDRVVAEIIRAVCALRPSFSERELTDQTNLSLDLGLESASRVELLLEVERALDVALEIGEVVVFVELTIGELANLIVPKVEGDATDRPHNPRRGIHANGDSCLYQLNPKNS